MGLPQSTVIVLTTCIVAIVTIIWFFGCFRRRAVVAPKIVPDQGLLKSFDRVVVVESTVSPEGNSGQHVYLREKTFDLDDNKDQRQGSVTYTLNLGQRYQTIKGFGGAFTDAAIHCLSKLPEEKAQEVMRRYFGSSEKTSAGYGIGRIHMGSCDFSIRNYALCDENDFSMRSMKLAPEDELRIRYIKMADEQRLQDDEFAPPLWLFGSPWTAPPWMKVGIRYNVNADGWNGGSLNPDPKYQEAWALYMSKWVSLYKDAGVSVSALTVQNEPTQLPLCIAQTWNTMWFSLEEVSRFVGDFLGPQIRKDHDKDIDIIIHDDQRRDLPNHVLPILDPSYQSCWEKLCCCLPCIGGKDAIFSKKAAQYISGIGYHWYMWVPAYITACRWLQSMCYSSFDKLSETRRKLDDIDRPDVYLIGTEACNGFAKTISPPCLGPSMNNWRRGEMYGEELIRGINNFSTGWCDWNLVLDTKGGPNWANNVCDAPVIANLTDGTVTYQPMFYFMVHVSRYIKTGAQRVHYEASKRCGLHVCAVVNLSQQDSTLVVVVLNRKASFCSRAQTYTIQVGEQSFTHRIENGSIQTLVFHPRTKARCLSSGPAVEMQTPNVE